MAVEGDEARYQAIAAEFDRIRSEVLEREKELESLKRMAPSSTQATEEEEVEAAMAVFDDITRIATDDRARGEINPLLVKLGLRLGLSLAPAIKGKKREVRQLVGGVMAFGEGRLPVPLYGSHNGEPAEEGMDQRGHRVALGEEGGPLGLAPPDATNMGDRDLRGEAGAELSSTPADLGRLDHTRSLNGQREGISFTRDNRGGGI
jgi:hypothetical protein